MAISSLGTVMLPRISNMISDGKRRKYKVYLKITLNTHKTQVCYKHVFNKFLLNSIRYKEQTKIKKSVPADYGYSKKSLIVSVLLSTSIAFGLSAVSNEFVPIFYGSGFDKCKDVISILVLSSIYI